MIGSSREKQGLNEKISFLEDEIRENLKRGKENLDKLPNQIDNMIKTNEEMKIGSSPDDTADYWEERKTIGRHIDELGEHKGKLSGLDKQHAQLDKATSSTLAAIKKNPDVETMRDLVEQLEKQALDVDRLANDIFDLRD